MEKKIPELEEYLASLKTELKVENVLKEDICEEIRQNLYDKFNELLIKGYGIDSSIACTLTSFEDPKSLGKMFNNVHKERIIFDKVVRFAYDRKAILAAIIATLLMAFTI